MPEAVAPPSALPRNQVRRIVLWTTIWLVLGFGFLLSLPIIFGWAAWLFLVIAAIAALLALALTWLLRRISERRRTERSFVASWLRYGLLTLFLLAILVAAPIYFLIVYSTVRPMTVPQAILSNGPRTVVYQGMIHIGSEDFYKSVVYDLEAALADGYVLFYEGVQPGTPEANAWFKNLLGGGGDLSANYKALGDACQLRFQLGYFDLLEKDRLVHPDRHVTADVSNTQLMQEYERLRATDPAFAKAMDSQLAAAKATTTASGASGDIAGIVNWINNMSEGQRGLAGVVCRGYMAISLGGEKERSEQDKLILDYRNRFLAGRILSDPHDKIYITYGSAHLPGVIALLQKADPRWQIKSVKWLRTNAPPDKVTGKF
jgi:hypothetical protein